MDVGNSAFDSDVESISILESEEFLNLNNQNKKTEKSEVDKSAKELTDFFEAVSCGAADPSEEEIDLAVEGIIARAFPEEKPTEAVKSDKMRKVTLRVLFVAALLSAFACSCLFVAGDKHNISMENGFITFAKKTARVVFFGEGEDFISAETLLADLEYHGFKDILFPSEFAQSGSYKIGTPVYIEIEVSSVSVDIQGDDGIYTFRICVLDKSQNEFSYPNVDDVEEVTLNGINFYIFNFDNNSLFVEFMKDGYRYSIKTDSDYSALIKIIESVN